MTDQEILKLIHSKEQALRENVAPAVDAEKVQKSLLGFLDEHLLKNSIISLRYQKLKTDKRWTTWWKTLDGYPLGNTWVEKFEPFVKILEEYLAEKTIKRRFEGEGFFVESRRQGEEGDEHLIIGKKNDGGEKAHVIIDKNTGEIRVEEGRKEPTELTRSIETILTLPDGRRIKSSRQAIELIEQDLPAPSHAITNKIDAPGAIMELWKLLNITYGWLMDFTAPIQPYIEVSRMSENQFEEWMDLNKFPASTKEELRNASDRTKRYSEMRELIQLQKTGVARTEFNNTLVITRPLLTAKISEAFDTINTAIYKVLSKMQIAIEAKDYKMRGEAATSALAIKEDITKLEELIRQELHGQ